jgi:hypothetical protein
MSCNSLLYALTNSTSSITSGSTIPLSTIVRRYGQNVNLSGNNISLKGRGYYTVEVSATLAAVAEGNLSVMVLQDGVAVPGANATVTATGAGDYVNLSVSCVVRLKGCSCADTDTSIISLVYSGTTSATPTNVSCKVAKV